MSFDARGFTAAVEVIDMHTHVCRSEAHGREMYEFFIMGFPSMSGPPIVPCLSTIEEAERLRQDTGVSHVNILMFTWSGKYYRAAQHMLPDDTAARLVADAKIREVILQRIVDNNQWAVDTVRQNKHYSTFCGIDPVLMDERNMLAEVEDKVRQGAKGVKMVPLDLGVGGDDERLWPLYDYLQAQEIPLQVQSGDIPGTCSNPALFGKAFADFPKMKVIFSHMGHAAKLGEGSDAEFRDLARQYDNVCGDLSERLLEVVDGHITAEQLVQFIRDVGTDRVMYGSNNSLIELVRPDADRGPEDPPQIKRTLQSLEAFAELPLTAVEQQRIAASNFREFVNLQ